jgi:hypothetical protein
VPPEFFREAYMATLLIKRGFDGAHCDAVLSDLEYASSRNSPIRTVMQGVRGISLAVFGTFLVLSVAFFTPLAVEYILRDPQIYEANIYLKIISHPLFISVIMGFIGSVVSIVLRLADFEGPTRKSQNFLLMTGLMLPLVGASFAAVTGAMVAAGIVNIKVGDGTNLSGPQASPYVFVVLGFIAGFSERFTRNMLAKVERTVDSDQGRAPGRPEDRR